MGLSLQLSSSAVVLISLPCGSSVSGSEAGGIGSASPKRGGDCVLGLLLTRTSARFAPGSHSTEPSE